MGELMRIFVPKCQIRRLFEDNSSMQISHVYRDQGEAEDVCERCQESGITTCSVAEPGVWPFTVDVDICDLR